MSQYASSTSIARIVVVTARLIHRLPGSCVTCCSSSGFLRRRRMVNARRSTKTAPSTSTTVNAIVTGVDDGRGAAVKDSGVWARA